MLSDKTRHTCCAAYALYLHKLIDRKTRMNFFMFSLSVCCVQLVQYGIAFVILMTVLNEIVLTQFVYVEYRNTSWYITIRDIS